MPAPDDLNADGAALWATLGQQPDTPTGRLALEACRAVDRLNELDSIIQGKGVLELMHFRRVDQHGDGSPESPVVIEVKFDNVLSEARQQQNALRQMLTSLAAMAKDAPVEPPVDKPKSTIDEFTQRRRERGA